MLGTSIVIAMETSLLTLQASKVVVMPLLSLIEGGKASGRSHLSCDDLRSIIRMQPDLEANRTPCGPAVRGQ